MNTISIKIKQYMIRPAGFMLILLFAISCDRSREDKGYEYFPDMAHGYDYKTYSENPAMEDGRTMRKPVEGTVPRHMQPYPYTADFEGRELAGQNLRNPLTITAGLLEDGRALYDIFCAQCHGVEGDGQGWLHTSGKYVIPPTSLLDDEIVAQPEGEMYHVISAGWGVMGEHGSLITPEQRWKIVAFIEHIIQEKK
ncbi:MAG: cytochrome c [Bacteroidetes bacterium]|nr:MAG: cytochrome c [Bacteroidota bacterium]